MIIYEVNISRITKQQTPLGEQINTKQLGGVLFNDPLIAKEYTAACLLVGLDAFIFPRMVVERPLTITLPKAKFKEPKP